MTNSDREAKHERNRTQRREQIRQWAAYVRTHPDADWGTQVNTVVNSQLQSAQHFEDDRPDIDALQDAPLLDDSNSD
jgi:hypothetical protein